MVAWNILVEVTGRGAAFVVIATLPAGDWIEGPEQALDRWLSGPGELRYSGCVLTPLAISYGSDVLRPVQAARDFMVDTNGRWVP